MLESLTSMLLNYKSMFWGGLLMAYGFSLILKALGIDIPIFKPIIGLFLMYFGFIIIMGYSPLLAMKRQQSASTDSYNIYFAKELIDLTHEQFNSVRKTIEINVVFGDVRVQLPQVPSKITACSAFANIEFPDADTVTFGSKAKYFNQSLQDGYLDIKANAQFGHIEFVQEDVY